MSLKHMFSAVHATKSHTATNGMAVSNFSKHLLLSEGATKQYFKLYAYTLFIVGTHRKTGENEKRQKWFHKPSCCIPSPCHASQPSAKRSRIIAFAG